MSTSTRPTACARLQRLRAVPVQTTVDIGLGRVATPLPLLAILHLHCQAAFSYHLQIMWAGVKHGHHDESSSCLGTLDLAR